MVAFHVPPRRDLAHNPGMCADWESNRQPLDSQVGTQPLSHTIQGQTGSLLTSVSSDIQSLWPPTSNTAGKDSTPLTQSPSVARHPSPTPNPIPFHSNSSQKPKSILLFCLSYEFVHILGASFFYISSFDLLNHQQKYSQ